jgi:hypothetical protein
VTGETDGSLVGPSAGGYDAWLARYDGAGKQIWFAAGRDQQLRLGHGAAPDGAGGVFVSGENRWEPRRASAGQHDAWVARYDSAGNKLWIRQLGTSNAEVAWAAASDGAGGVFVCGDTGGSFGSDAWLARYDAAWEPALDPAVWGRHHGLGQCSCFRWSGWGVRVWSNRVIGGEQRGLAGTDFDSAGIPALVPSAWD